MEECKGMMSKLPIAIAFLLLNFYVYHFMARQAVIPPREHFSRFPLELADWRCPVNEPLPHDILDNLGATDTLVCNYIKDDHTSAIGLYIGYHATQIREEGGGSGENAIHPPAHCLPGSGWDIVDSRTVPIDLPGLTDPKGTAKRLIIARGEQRQLVYYWYQMGGRVVSEDWHKILFVGYDRATRGRTDGALVRFTMALGRRGDEAAEAKLRDFARLVVPLLPRYVPS
jgi:EpsI family protein